ncbi:hypothetical protein GCM10022221_33550 [Actinocorallia aurea]
MSFPGGRRALWVGIAAAVVVIAVVAGVLLARGGEPEHSAANPDVPTLETDPPSAPPIPPDTVPSETPEVTPQAEGLDPVDLDEAPAQGDGALDSGACDRHYGESTQCVPAVFPDGITEYADKCLWLEVNGFGDAVAVKGGDPQRLDPDGNKIACDG